MPNVKVPSLKQLPDGRWFTKWGERRHYFGRDRRRALAKFADSLQYWEAWRARRVRAVPSRPLTVVRLQEMFVAAKTAEGDVGTGRYYADKLRRFTAVFGPARADRMTAASVFAVRDAMLTADPPYARKSINHDTVAIKCMLQWAINRDLIPIVNLAGIRQLPLGPAKTKALSIETVRTMIGDAPANVASWLAVNYLALLRPTEVIRLVHGQGEWVEDGVFRLDRGKVDLKTAVARHLVLSPLALRWLKRCDPVWSHRCSYYLAVRRGCGRGGPHLLRHSAATHLVQAGVTRADVDLLLGHMPSRVSLTYAPISWQPLRRTVARLRLPPPASRGSSC